MKESSSHKRAVAATGHNVTILVSAITTCINCERYTSVDPCRCAFLITSKIHRYVCVWKRVCSFVVMFVVLKVTKVGTGDVREIYTKITKGKHEDSLMEGFLNTLRSSLKEFIIQLIIYQQNMCHGLSK